MNGDPQLRWIGESLCSFGSRINAVSTGPEKGVIALATAAVVNALWDMYARAEGKPLWRLICDMTPEEYVKATAFRYIPSNKEHPFILLTRLTGI